MPASPVKRIEVLPATRTITAGDSIRIELRALDADGKPIPGTVLYAKLLGGDGEGSLDPASGWLVASSVGKFPLTVWVACNKSNELVEIDAGLWTLRRRIPAGEGIYNLAASADGRLLVATNKKGKSVSVFEAASGKELARIATTRRVPSGLVISPDGRYAFGTQEGVGSEPGAVDIIDLRTLQHVASVDVGQQAGGIDFWKAEAVAR
jgi:DNA-binding beta-propeller fold protein YncE